MLCWQMQKQALCLLARASDHSSLIWVLFKRPPQQRVFGLSTHRAFLHFWGGTRIFWTAAIASIFYTLSHQSLIFYLHLHCFQSKVPLLKVLELYRRCEVRIGLPGKNWIFTYVFFRLTVTLDLKIFLKKLLPPLKTIKIVYKEIPLPINASLGAIYSSYFMAYSYAGKEKEKASLTTDIRFTF